MKLIEIPRVLIAGISGDSGKTFVSLGILAKLKEKGLKIAVYKKGPDYIDPMWLNLASGKKTRILDLYLIPETKIKKTFIENSRDADITLIEGNRGLFDGLDAEGKCSSAELSVLLKTPVILVLPIIKMTRSSAAVALGFKNLDSRVNIAGIILNFCAGKRHYETAKNAIEDYTGIPVLGCIPKIKDETVLHSRHLGLITPQECIKAQEIIENAKKIVSESCDIDKIIDISKSALSLEVDEDIVISESSSKKIVKIGYFYDESYSFYYVENLEELEKRGAELIKISPIRSEQLPDIDGLYIGGGFPEVHIEALSKNVNLINQLKNLVEKGLPVYAECGGLMYLAKDLTMDGFTYPLLNIFDISLVMENRPVGHGYMEVEVVKENPFFKIGSLIRGHEFHYSKVTRFGKNLEYCMKVNRGVGIDNYLDGLIYKNVFASYLHLHTYSYENWPGNFIELAEWFSIQKNIYKQNWN